jgi:hypothetical protein
VQILSTGNLAVCDHRGVRGIFGWLVLLTACGRINFEGAASTADGALPCVSPPPPFDVGATYTRTLFVATDGDNTNDGSEAAPLATLLAAAKRATPGTDIRVAPGLYGRLSSSDLRGERDRPIRFIGGPGVVIEGPAGDTAIYLGSPQYVVLEALTIRNAGFHGVHVDSNPLGTIGVGVVIRGLRVEEPAIDCVKVFWTDDVHVLDSELSDCGTLGVHFVGVAGGVVARNTITRARRGLRAGSGSTDIVIHANRFASTTERTLQFGDTDDLYLRPGEVYQASRIRAVANILTNTGSEPILFDDSDDVEVAHTTILDPMGPLVRILHTNAGPVGGARNGRFHSNLVAFRDGTLDPVVQLAAGSSPASFSFAHNLWWVTDGGAFAGPQLPAEIPPEVGSVLADPGVQADGSIDIGSPAVGGGVAGATAQVDVDGQCYRDVPAIGADEPY